jgi:hypothetical protein
MRPAAGAFLNTGGSAFSVAFDDLNGGTRTEEVCPSSALRDDFEVSGPPDGTLWRVDRAGCSRVDASNGSLVFEGSTGTFSCRLESATIYDVVFSTVDTNPSLALEPGVAGFFELRLLDGAFARFQMIDNTIEAQYVDKEGTTSSVSGGRVPYTVDHAYWRFSGGTDVTNAGRVEWLVSGNGVDYTTFGAIGGLTDLDRVGVNFGIFGNSAGSNVGEFGQINIPPE